MRAREEREEDVDGFHGVVVELETRHRRWVITKFKEGLNVWEDQM